MEMVYLLVLIGNYTLTDAYVFDIQDVSESDFPRVAS
jgi:hypothetical protein